MSATKLASLFIHYVWRLHGLPDSIVSDRGSLFVSEFWKAVCQRLRIRVDLSTSFHPESDGQTEIANAATAEYLRFYVNYMQEDWEEWLPMAEFAANNTVSSSTGMSPFFANKGFHPRVSFGAPRAIPAGASATITKENGAGTTFADKMEDILGVLRSNLANAQASQEEQANRKRTPAPAYRPGDEVFLSTKNMTTDRPTKKFDNKYAGPYEIERPIGTHAYRLRIPYEMGKTHPTFHTNLLRPAPATTLPGQYNPPERPVTLDADGEKLWAIEAIIDSRRTKKNFEYLIHWRGYSAEDQSWESLRNVVNAYTATRNFHKLHPKKPKPTKKEIDTVRKL